MDFEIRQATIDDIPEITSLFRNTIININSRDYSDKQIKVWASGADDIEKWEKRINNDYFIVAEANNQIIGFSYLTKGNYLDGLFIETHFDPANAKSDGANMLHLDNLEGLLTNLVTIRKTINSLK